MDKELERQIVELWSWSPYNPKPVAEMLNVTEKEVIDAWHKAGIKLEVQGGQPKQVVRRLKLKGWRLDIDNFLRKQISVPFLTALMAQTGDYITNDQFKNIADGLELTYRDIADNIGLDYMQRNDYNKISGYFLNERKAFVTDIQDIGSSDTFVNWKKMGLNEHDLFAGLVLNLLKRGRYPIATDPKDLVYAQDDGKTLRARRLRVITLEDLLRLVIQGSAIRIDKQVQHKRDLVITIDKYIPILDKITKIEFHDGTMFQLPIICPMDKLEFHTADEFKEHLETAHQPNS